MINFAPSLARKTIEAELHGEESEREVIDVLGEVDKREESGSSIYLYYYDKSCCVEMELNSVNGSVEDAKLLGMNLISYLATSSDGNPDPELIRNCTQRIRDKAAGN